jgi:hypothetical protein
MEKYYCRYLNGVILTFLFAASYMAAAQPYNISIADPILQKFQYNAGTGNIQFTFHKSIVPSSLNITRFSLQSNQTVEINVTETFFLSKYYNSLTLQASTFVVNIYLTSSDYNVLKLKSSLGKSNTTTFVTMEHGAIFGAFVPILPSRAINSSDAFRVTTFIKDTIPAFLTKYNLDMNSGVMNLTFSEPIDSTSFQIEGLAFQNFRNDFQETSSYVKLVRTGGYTATVYGKYLLDVSVQLGVQNLDLIKIRGNLCTNYDTTFLSIFQSFVNDTSGNPIVLPLYTNSFYNGIPPTAYVFDTTSPILLSWDFNSNTGVLILFFSEVVDLAFFNYSKITLSTDRIITGSTTLVRIDAPGPPVALLANFMNLTIVGDKLDQLRVQPKLFKDIAFSYIVLAPEAVRDAAQLANHYLGLDATPTNAMQISQLLHDTTPPIVEFFTVDMNTQTITLTLSKIINIQAFQLAQLTLQASSFDAAISVRLISSLASVLTVVNSRIIVIRLSSVGFSTIMVLTNLFVSLETSYISYTTQLVRDTALGQNFITPVGTNFARIASAYTPNLRPPAFLSWGIDMGNELLFLNFSIPMDIRTVKFPFLRLTSDELVDASTFSRNLSINSFVISSQLSNFVVKLSLADMIDIKSKPPFCTSASRCFLSIDSQFGSTVPTFFTNGTITQAPVSSIFFLASAIFSVDKQPPTLKFFTIDMSVGSLLLQFSEVVRGQDIVTSGITLLGQGSQVGPTLRLTLSSFGVENTAANLTINLSYFDFMALKKIPSIGTNLANTFLVIDGNSVMDMARNFLIGGSVKMTQTVVPDNKAPELIAFVYDRTSLNLTVYFNDVIQASTADISSFNLYSSPYNPSTAVTLSISSSTIKSRSNTNRLFLRVYKPPLEINLIGRIGVQTSTNLYTSKFGGVVDASPALNRINSMLPLSAVLEGQTPLYFRLDMDHGLILVEFTYAYNLIPIIVSTGIRLQVCDI